MAPDAVQCQPPMREPRPPDPARRRRLVFYLVTLLVCCVAGAALIALRPIILIAVVLAALLLTVILRRLYSPTHYVRILWRRRGIMLLCTVTTFCFAFVALQFVHNQYDSEVTLQIEESQVLSQALKELMGGVLAPPRGRGVDEERMAKLAVRIRSRPFLERVVRMLRMHEDPMIQSLARGRAEDHPELTEEQMAIRILVENLRARIRFRGEGPGIYRITIADFSPRGAQLLARWISELFVQISDEDVEERLRTAHEFGTEQLGLYKEELRKSEEALVQYKSSQIKRSLAHRMVHADNFDLAEALQRRIANEVDRRRARAKADSLAFVGLGLPGSQSALVGDGSIRELSEELTTTLKSRVMERLAGFAVGELDLGAPGSHKTPRPDPQQQVETVVASRHPEVSPEVAGAVARFVLSKVDLEAQVQTLEMLESAIETFKQQVRSAPRDEIELARLAHDVAVNRELLQGFQAQLISTDISQAVEMAKLRLRIQVLDPACLPVIPSYPDRMRILLSAILLGALIGVWVCFAAETTHPISPTKADGRPWLRRHWVAVVVAAMILLSAFILVVRNRILHELVASGTPVQMVDPESDVDDDP